VERENGRIKEKGWGRRAERVGWAGQDRKWGSEIRVVAETFLVVL